MIGFINGIVEFKESPYLIVNVNGVGYRVLVSSNIFSKTNLSENIKLFIYTHVREDTLDLYGFLSNSDLKLFQNIIGVSGIGPKTAIGIFSIAGGSEIVDAVAKGRVDFFTNVPRLGKKNAQKLIIELRPKIGSLEELDLVGEGDGDSQEIISALKTFGFTQKESLDAVKSIKDKTDSVEDKIRLALKYLGK